MAPNYLHLPPLHVGLCRYSELFAIVKDLEAFHRYDIQSLRVVRYKSWCSYSTVPSVRYLAILGTLLGSILRGKPPVAVLLSGVARLGVLILTAYPLFSSKRDSRKETSRYVRKISRCLNAKVDQNDQCLAERSSSCLLADHTFSARFTHDIYSNHSPLNNELQTIIDMTLLEEPPTFTGQPETHNYAAILLDMDGTIVDSTNAIVKHWHK